MPTQDLKRVITEILGRQAELISKLDRAYQQQEKRAKTSKQVKRRKSRFENEVPIKKNY
jgi:hypothetical protein